MEHLTRRSFNTVAAGVAASGLTTAAASHADAATTPVTPSGRVVTRYVAMYKDVARVRSTPSTAGSGSVVGYLGQGAAVIGTYSANRLWFVVTSGRFKGRFIASSLLVAGPQLTSFNGQLALNDLVALPYWAINSDFDAGVTRYLSRAAATSFLQMDSAFHAQFGVHLQLSAAYRNLATQRALYRSLGPSEAAVPGTSNHGLGNAIDLGLPGRQGAASPFCFGHVYERWMTANGGRWGYERPAYMGIQGSMPEWWHFNFAG